MTFVFCHIQFIPSKTQSLNKHFFEKSCFRGNHLKNNSHLHHVGPKHISYTNVHHIHPAGDVLWVFVEPGNVVP